MFQTCRIASVMARGMIGLLAFFVLSSTALAAVLPQSFPPPRRVVVCPGTVSVGQQGEQVSRLQRELNREGFRGPDGGLLLVNGRFDDRTLFAVKRFQLKHHLSVDGVVRAQMWQLAGQC